MRVWIDQDCCTGAGLCVQRQLLQDGLGCCETDTQASPAFVERALELHQIESR
jgi:ferredoxin